MDPEDALSWQRSSRTDTRSISSRTRRKEVQLAAVKNDGRAIQYIENPSEAVQLAAIKQDGLAIQYI
jgi:hypothetical protein